MTRLDTWTRTGDDGCSLTGTIARAVRLITDWAWRTR